MFGFGSKAASNALIEQPMYANIEQAENGFIVRTSKSLIPVLCKDMEGVAELLCETFGVELED